MSVRLFVFFLFTIPLVKCQDSDAGLVETLRGEVEQLRKELGESQSTVEKLRNDFQVERKNLFDWRDRSNKIEKDLEADRERLKSMAKDLEDAKQKLGVEKQNNEALRAKIDGQGSEAQQADEQLKRMEGKNRELEDSIKSYRKELAEANASLVETAKTKDAELEKALAERRDLLVSVESLKKDLNAKTELHKEVEAKLALHAEKATSLAGVESELERAKERISELVKSKKQTANELEGTKTQLQASKDTLFQVRREFLEVKEELSEYKEQAAFWPKIGNLVQEEISDFSQRLLDTAKPVFGDLRPYCSFAYYQAETGVVMAMTLASSVSEEIMVAAPEVWQQVGGDTVTEQTLASLEEIGYFGYHKELVQSVQKAADTALAYVTIEKAPKYVYFVVEKWQSNCEGIAILLEIYAVIILLVMIYTIFSGMIHFVRSKSRKLKIE